MSLGISNRRSDLPFRAHSARYVHLAKRLLVSKELGRLIFARGRFFMPKKNVTARLEEKQLRQVGRYLKTRRPAETVRAALDFVAEKAAHEKIVKKYSGVGEPDAFQDS